MKNLNRKKIFLQLVSVIAGLLFLCISRESGAQCTTTITGPAVLGINQTGHYSVADACYRSWFLLQTDPDCGTSGHPPCTQPYFLTPLPATEVDINAGPIAGEFVILVECGGSLQCYKFVTIEEPLPVELSSFTSIINGADVSLKWTTSSEVNNSGFEIERSSMTNGTQDNWVNVGFVIGAGNSNLPQHYSFGEKNLNSGKYKYRLKQIDFNGSFEYHNLNEEISIGTPENFGLSQNYPNPFNPVTKIDYELPVSGFVKISVYDIAGRDVITLVNEMKQAGRHRIDFDGSNLESGAYYYKMTSGNYSKVMKMLLIK